MNERVKIEKIGRLIAIILFLSGLAGFLLGLVVTATSDAELWNGLEFPLGNPESMAANQKGQIFCALGFYSRIQQYDAHGNFIKGWSYPGSGRIRLRINNYDQLEIADPRKLKTGDHPDVLSVYDETGRLVNQRVVDECWEAFGTVSETEYTTPGGVRYHLANRYILPRIEREDSSGSSIVIQVPFYLFPVAGPLPSLLTYLVAGITWELLS